MLGRREGFVHQYEGCRCSRWKSESSFWMTIDSGTRTALFYTRAFHRHLREHMRLTGFISRGEYFVPNSITENKCTLPDSALQSDNICGRRRGRKSGKKEIRLLVWIHPSHCDYSTSFPTGMIYSSDGSGIIVSSTTNEPSPHPP